MSFKEYHSIENHYREKFIEYIKRLNLGEFCAMEKVHGCNVSFIMTKVEGKLQIQKATRNRILDEKEGFFQLPEIQKKYEANLEQLFNKIETENKLDTLVVRLYGELFGSCYPGGKSKHAAVQKGIYYSPDTNFLAFDVMVADVYMNYDKAIELFKECSISYLPILHRGTLEELLKLDPIFKSTIPTLLGCDEKIDLGANHAEGYVLKPLECHLIARNDAENAQNRIILKLKNPAFDEVGKKSVSNVKEKIIVEIPESLQTYALGCINANRYDSVISKLTEEERKNKGKVIPAMIKDIMTDVEKDHVLEVAVKKLLNSYVSKHVGEFLKTHLAN